MIRQGVSAIFRCGLYGGGKRGMIHVSHIFDGIPALVCICGVCVVKDNKGVVEDYTESRSRKSATLSVVIFSVPVPPVDYIFIKFGHRLIREWNISFGAVFCYLFV